MTLKIYFRSTTSALAAKVYLLGLIVSQPMFASPPREGRSVILQVTLPDYAVADRGARARMMARVISVANRYDGIVLNTQNNQEIK